MEELIDDGVLPRPRRTVRFMWVPEIQGTNANLDRYPDETKRMVAAVSMDMVGEDVTKNHNSLHLMRTPYSVNHFINEIPHRFWRIFRFVESITCDSSLGRSGSRMTRRRRSGL